VGCLVSPVVAQRVTRKASLFALGTYCKRETANSLAVVCAGVLHFLFGRDKKFKKPKPNPDDVLLCDVRLV